MTITAECRHNGAVETAKLIIDGVLVVLLVAVLVNLRQPTDGRHRPDKATGNSDTSSE